MLRGVEGGYFAYTGDRAEGLMLRIYGLRPRVGTRRPVSAVSAKTSMYRAASGLESDWYKYVTKEVASVIEKHWGTVERFANAEDRTRRVLGMKFPKDGY